MGDLEIMCLSCPAFYEKMMSGNFDIDALGIIVKHFAFENHKFSITIANAAMKGLQKNPGYMDDNKSYI